MKHLHSKPWLAIEVILLMVALPLFLYLVLPIRYLLPVIWAVALCCHLSCRALAMPTIQSWWVGGMVTWANVRPILRRFLFAAVLLTVATYLLAPEMLFGMLRTKPAFWLLIMVLYPVLSVVPQEIIFRRFFFARYTTLFTRPSVMITASAIAFGIAHILFHNWIAPALCVVGGALFAQTYARHRSLALVALEHALYGDFLFTLGLGRYFYHGTVAAMVH